jgi:virginiamycin B lyase
MVGKIFTHAAVAVVASAVGALSTASATTYYDLPKGDGPHDVAPAPDGTVWYTGQRAGWAIRPQDRQG